MTTPTTSIASAFESLARTNNAIHLTAYDGSQTGPRDGIHVHVANERAVNYVITAPGSLGLARAYLMGDLIIDDLDEGNPYELLRTFEDDLALRPVRLSSLRDLGGFLATHPPRVPELPASETPGPLRRIVSGLRHGRTRDADAISHHYDVSNEFYELVLGPSMAYTCAVFRSSEDSLEDAQAEKFDLVCRKLALAPGMRLLDVGCGWGGMVRHAARHYGVTALGVTLSREQASWAQAAIERDGLAGRATVRFGDYRDATEAGFDAVSSIGLTEHIGPENYPAYFDFLRARLRDGGRLLNHCITREDNRHPGIPQRGFINRYVFPDGGLTGSGDIVRAAENSGLEVRHHENLREHYALTLKAWCENLSKHWDECVSLAGLQTARVWGLYLAGSQLSFERNRIQLHQVLLTRNAADGTSGYPLRHGWAP